MVEEGPVMKGLLLIVGIFAVFFIILGLADLFAMIPVLSWLMWVFVGWFAWSVYRG